MNNFISKKYFFNMQLKVHSWGYLDNEDTNELEIHAAGITLQNENVFVKIKNFRVWVYLQLPKHVAWTNYKCKLVYEYMCKFAGNCAPVKYYPVNKRNLYFSEQISSLKLEFQTARAAIFFAAKINKQTPEDPVIFIPDIDGLKKSHFVVHESNLDPIIKFIIERRLEPSGWINISDSSDAVDDDADFSICDYNIVCHPEDVSMAVGVNGITFPKFVSFDLETYSVNHASTQPNSKIDGNKIFQCGAIVGHLGKDELSRHLFVVGECGKIDGVEIVECENEPKFLLHVAQFIHDTNPCIFIGYNILKFDWDYIVSRCERYGILNEFLRLCSRLRNVPATSDKLTWKSAAYGTQEFSTVTCPGRIHIDVLQEVERNYKRSSYKLDLIAEEFLGERKDDVTPRQMFMIVYVQDFVRKCDDINECKNVVRTSLVDMYLSQVLKTMKRQALKCVTVDDIRDRVKEMFTLVGKYCVQDCALPVKLAMKLNLFISMEETSNVTKVPMSYIHTRGAQIKVVAALYAITHHSGFIIPFQRRIDDSEKKKYVGALVADAYPGYYENVACFDFASLYPTAMITENICYTTIVRPDDPIPDSECNVLEWEDHRGCEHDATKRDVKKDMVLCQKHRYRFRKMKLLADGTRIGEGIMPMFERTMLSERKKVKKEMEKWEAVYAMATGKASQQDIDEYISNGWSVVERGSKSDAELQVIEQTIKVLNARQLALKVIANSAYGIKGAQQGMIPLIEGAASITYIGRTLITKANEYLFNVYAGVIKKVYGDTDSTMVYFAGKNVQETFDIARVAAQRTTAFLRLWLMGLDEDATVLNTVTNNATLIRDFNMKNINTLSDSDKIKIHTYNAIPISLTFENLYGKYFLLTKKRYCAQIVNYDGKVIKDTKKGVVLARRDNCKFLRDTYKQLILKIMQHATKDEILDVINSRVHAVFTRQLPDTDFVIYIGIKSLLEYAKQKEFVRVDGVKIKGFYNKFQPTKIIEDVSGPLDPRLDYPNIPQVILALKLWKRGNEVPAGTRLEFLYAIDSERTSVVEHQGEAAEDYTTFKDNKGRYSVDKIHYITKQLSKPVTELMNVKFPGKAIPYIPYHDVLREEIMTTLQPELRSSCLLTKDVVYIYNTLSKGDRPCRIKHSGFDAHCKWILQRCAVSNDVPESVVSAARLYNSKRVLDAVYTRFSLTKRQLPPKPPQASYNLKLGTKKRGATKIMFIRPFTTQNDVIINRGEYAELKNVVQVKERERSIRGIEKDVVKNFYTVTMTSTNVEIQNVPREYITTFVYAEEDMMENIVAYRTYFAAVIRQLNELCYPFRIVQRIVQGTITAL